MLQAKWRKFVAFAAAFVSLQAMAWAQRGYTSSPALNPHQVHSLDKALLVMGIPPLMIFIGIFFYFYRRRAKSRDT